MTIEELLSSKGIEYKTLGGGKWLDMACPFTEHNKPDGFRVDAETGGFICMKCEEHGGPTQLKEKLGASHLDVKVSSPQKNREPLPPLPIEDVLLLHQKLLDIPRTNELWKYVYEKRGLTDESIKKFKIGWNGKQLIIPYFDEKGDVYGAKMRNNPLGNPLSKYINIKGYGGQLFNRAVLLQDRKIIDRIIVCEGEFDAIRLQQEGYDAVTSTVGAMSFKEGWVLPFKEKMLAGRLKKIYICYDSETSGTGLKGAEHTAELFWKHNVPVHIIKLPPPPAGRDKLDITDFFNQRKEIKNPLTPFLQDAEEYKGNGIKDDTSEFMTISQMHDMEFPMQKWIVESIIAHNGVSAIIAESGSYKTYFTLYMISCILRGEKVLGLYETQKTKILVIDKENYIGNFFERVVQLGITKEEGKNLFYHRGNFMITDENYLLGLEKKIKEEGIGLVVIDTLIRSHSLDENSASDMNKIYQGINRIKRAGAAVFYLHHFNKNEGASIVKRARGSGDLVAQLDSLISTEKLDDNGLIKLTWGKMRNGRDPSPVTIRFKVEDGKASFNFDYTIESLKDPKEVIKQEILKSLAIKPYAGTEIKTMFGALGSPMTIQRALEDLLGKEVKRDRIPGRGKNFIYSLQLNEEINF